MISGPFNRTELLPAYTLATCKLPYTKDPQLNTLTKPQKPKTRLKQIKVSN
jgi:hypothetical protein